MIKAETDPIVDALRENHAEAMRETSLQALREFMDEQRAMLSRIAEEAESRPDGVGTLLDENSAASKRAQLQKTMATLTEFAA